MGVTYNILDLYHSYNFLLSVTYEIINFTQNCNLSMEQVHQQKINLHP